jgi:hypothetical protein
MLVRISSFRDDSDRYHFSMQVVSEWWEEQRNHLRHTYCAFDAACNA